MNPDLIKTAELFDTWAQRGKAEGMESGHSPRALHALERISLKSGQRILDLGCGNGWATRWMRERLGDGEAYGIDASALMIERAQSQSEAISGLHFSVGEFEKLSFPDQHFDHIFSFEALYYSIDLQQALSEIKRVLKTQGTLTLGTDYYQENPQCHDWQDRMQIPMTLLSTESWREQISAAGLTVVEDFRCLDPRPVDESLSEAEQLKIRSFREEIGSLAIVAKKVD